MPRGFIATYNMLSFNSREAAGIIHKEFGRILETSVQAWVKTAESIIPNWSGMSRGTLVELAGLVGVQISLFVAASAQPPRGPGDRSSDGQAQSSARLINVPGRYGFEYRSNVFHLAVNENADATQFGFRLRKPGPYNFRQQADRVFQTTFRKQVEALGFARKIRSLIRVKSERRG